MDDDVRITRDNSPRAHRLVARNAKEMCAELYDVYAQKMPGFYERWPSQNEFVRHHWFLFIEESRAMLARLLGTNIREDLKKEIYDALLRDASLTPTRSKYVQVRLDV